MSVIHQSCNITYENKNKNKNLKMNQVKIAAVVRVE
jgi:hypothetical protein